MAINPPPAAIEIAEALSVDALSTFRLPPWMSGVPEIVEEPPMNAFTFPFTVEVALLAPTATRMPIVRPSAEVVAMFVAEPVTAIAPVAFVTPLLTVEFAPM